MERETRLDSSESVPRERRVSTVLLTLRFSCRMSEGEQRLSCPECVSRKGKQTEKKGQLAIAISTEQSDIRHFRYILHVQAARGSRLILQKNLCDKERAQCDYLEFGICHLCTLHVYQALLLKTQQFTCALGKNIFFRGNRLQLFGTEYSHCILINRNSTRRYLYVIDAPVQYSTETSFTNYCLIYY